MDKMEKDGQNKTQRINRCSIVFQLFFVKTHCG